MTAADVDVVTSSSSSLSLPNKEGHGSDDFNDGTVDGSSTYSSLRSSSIAVDRMVHYAGEANYPDYRGTVHGAYISGTEAAYRVIAIDKGDE
jgi:monoamine oxidase